MKITKEINISCGNLVTVLDESEVAFSHQLSFDEEAKITVTVETRSVGCMS